MIALATFDYIDADIRLDLRPRYKVPVDEY